MTTRRLYLMVVLVAVMLAVLVWFYPSNSDFKGENPSWNGARDFLSDFQALSLNSLDALPATSQGTTLIVVPYIEFTPADLDKLEHYVNSGGKLVVLDDYGFGNAILEHLELEVRFTGSQLLDPLFDYKNKNLPKIINFAPDPATTEVENLVFNHATTLENVPQDQVVAQSSYFSFLDEDQNGEWNEGEPKGPLPVIADFKIGKGELILISDPSILISSMLGMEDNQQFLENVAQGQIFLDQSHLPEVPLDEAKVVLKISRNVLATIGATLVLIVLILAFTLKPIWYKGGQSD
mgnify:CR=1 FL=1